MKQHLIIVMAMLALCCSSCKQKNTPENKPVEAPLWEYTPNPDTYQTMSVVCAIPTAEMDKIAAEDELAALASDNTVLGVGHHVGNGIYYLMVAEPLDEDWTVTIAYYQSANKRLFKAEGCITFSPDDVVGTYSQPYMPFNNK